jgi:hypothetical protein
VRHPLPAVGFLGSSVQPGTADRLRARRGAGRHPGPEHHAIWRRQQHLPVDRVHRELPAHQHLREQLEAPASRQYGLAQAEYLITYVTREGSGSAPGLPVLPQRCFDPNLLPIRPIIPPPPRVPVIQSLGAGRRREGASGKAGQRGPADRAANRVPGGRNGRGPRAAETGGTALSRRRLPTGRENRHERALAVSMGADQAAVIGSDDERGGVAPQVRVCKDHNGAHRRRPGRGQRAAGPGCQLRTQLLVPASPRRVSPLLHKPRSGRPARLGLKRPDDCARDRRKILPLPATNRIAPESCARSAAWASTPAASRSRNAEHSQTHALRSRIS